MPKTRTFDFEVEGAPSEVSARLRARVSAGALRGDSRHDGFSLSLVPRPFSGRLRAVAEGALIPAGERRTRVVGRCALPAFAVWYLRIAWPAMALLLGAFGWSALQEPLQVSLVMLGWLALMLGFSVVGIGFNVWTADAQVEPLVDAVQHACGVAAGAEIVGVREAER